MARRKGDDFISVELRLDSGTDALYKEWARLAGVTPEQVMAVVLARQAMLIGTAMPKPPEEKS